MMRASGDLEGAVEMASEDLAIPLAQVVSSLRRELEEAVDESHGHDLRFRLGPVVLELEFALGREDGGQGGVQFWVLALGGTRKRASTATHRVKLVLEPE